MKTKKLQDFQVSYDITITHSCKIQASSKTEAKKIIKKHFDEYNSPEKKKIDITITKINKIKSCRE
jgi:hypothetical protein